MKLTIDRKALANELHLLQGIVAGKVSVPILANVLLDAQAHGLRVAATDLDVSLSVLRRDAEVTEPGSLAVNARKANEIVRALPDGTVSLSSSLSSSEEWVEIASGSAHYKIPTLSSDDYPSLPNQAFDSLLLPCDVLYDLIQRTQFAITAEDARYYLAGALLIVEAESLTMVTTDGHRLAYAKAAAKHEGTDTRILIPRKAIQALLKLADSPEESVALELGDSHITFGFESRRLSCKKIDAAFPEHTKVIEQHGKHKAVIERETFLTAVKRVALLADQSSHGVLLTLANGTLGLKAQSVNNGTATESIDAEYEGDGVETGFNATYLVDFLSAVSSKKVRLELTDAEQSGILTPCGDDTDHRYVVMPMRL